MEKNIYTDGPVVIPEKDLAGFNAMVSEGYETQWLFDSWLDGKNSPDVRRAIIRQLIASREIDEVLQCYGEELRKQLSNRPVLLEQMTSELLYRMQPENNASTGKYDFLKTWDGLIEFLLPVVNEDIGRKLVERHSLYDESKDFLATLSEGLFGFPADGSWGKLSLWLPSKGMPEWFRETLWADVGNAVRAEADKYSIIMAETGDAYAANPNNKANLITSRVATVALDNLSTEPGHENLLAVVPCMRLLEDVLPQGVAYCSISDAVRLAQKLPDTLLAMRFARRCVMNIRPERVDNLQDLFTGQQNIQGRNFLHWLQGLASRLTPDDTELLEKIDIIFEIAEKATEVGTDESPAG